MITISTKTKRGTAIIAIALCIAMVFSVVPRYQNSAYADDYDVQNFEIPGIGKVYYVVNPAYHVHGEWEHVDAVAGDNGEKAFRKYMFGNYNFAYYVEKFPELPSANGVEDPENGIPEKLYGTTKMSHLEFWKSQGVDSSTLTNETSSNKDTEGNYDLGGFDTVSRGTVTYDFSYTGSTFDYKINGLGITGGTSESDYTYDDDFTLVTPTFTPNSYAARNGGMSSANFSMSNGLFNTDPTDESAKQYLFDKYEISGFEAMPVSVNGIKYIESMVLDDIGQSIPAAFKNVTIGGTLNNIWNEGSDSESSYDDNHKTIEVDDETGLLMNLKNDGTYEKVREGKNEMSYDIQSNGGWDSTIYDVISYNYRWGDYQDAYVYLHDDDSDPTDASGLSTEQWNNYAYNFIGAKYEYYGDVGDSTNFAGVNDPTDINDISDLDGKTVKKTYGTNYVLDTWISSKTRIELGFNFDSLRLGGDGTSTAKYGVNNYDGAQGKTGFYKVTLYALGHNNVEKLVYIKNQFKEPDVIISNDMDKITLDNLEPEVKSAIESKKATVKLQTTTIRSDGKSVPSFSDMGTLVDFDATSNSYSYIVDPVDDTKKELGGLNTKDANFLSAGTIYRVNIILDDREEMAPIEVDIKPTVAKSISVTPNDLSLSANKSSNLKTEFNSSDLSITWLGEKPVWVETDVTWTSSNTSVATVDAEGKVTAKSNGTATITATLPATKNREKATATTKVTVKGYSVPAVTLNKKNVTLYHKGSKNNTTLKATVTGDSKAVTWKSSNTKVATVNAKGKVTAKKKGTAKITATANGVSATATITVKKATLKLKKAKATIRKGKKYTIKATATPKAKVTYKSSNKKVATVSKKGVIKAKKKGKAKITVTANGIKKKFTVKVKK